MVVAERELVGLLEGEVEVIILEVKDGGRVVRIKDWPSALYLYSAGEGVVCIAVSFQGNGESAIDAFHVFIFQACPLLVVDEFVQLCFEGFEYGFGSV